MRTKDKQQRRLLADPDPIKLFQPELNYYRKRNVTPFQFRDRTFLSLYKRLNIQIVVTKVCNFRCGFCIENDTVLDKTKTDLVSVCKSLRELLRVTTYAGLRPCISITGGEPSFAIDTVAAVLDICTAYGIGPININTNGTALTQFPQGHSSFNVSRHHYEQDKINNIFVTNRSDPLDALPPQTMMQCVALSGYIDSLDECRKYMAHWAARGAAGFSFRGLSSLDAGKNYAAEIAWTRAHHCDVGRIADAAANAADFQFIQQKIGDHYWYEICKWNDLPVRFTYSDFDWLRQVEQAERASDAWFTRAMIVHPNGDVFSGWTYEINNLQQVIQNLAAAAVKTNEALGRM